MKMIVSAFVLFVLFLSSSVSNPCPIGAQETVEFQAIEKPVTNAQIDLPREFGTVSSKIEAGIDGAFVPLYPTFDFPSEALSSIRRNEALQAVMKAYALDPIDGNNWARYAELSMALLDSPDRPAWYCESDERVSELRLFFDIFENDERNIEAITRLESADPGEEARELMLTLPSASFEELSGWTEIASARHSTAVRSFDSNAAFEYALTYSTSAIRSIQVLTRIAPTLHLRFLKAGENLRFPAAITTASMSVGGIEMIGVSIYNQGPGRLLMNS